MQVFCYLYVFFSITLSVILGLVISPMAFFISFGATALGCILIATIYEALNPDDFIGVYQWQRKLGIWLRRFNEPRSNS
mgnify:FL=1